MTEFFQKYAIQIYWLIGILIPSAILLVTIQKGSKILINKKRIFEFIFF